MVQKHNHESSHIIVCISLEVMYCQNSEENKYLKFSTFKKKDKYSLAFFLLLLCL